MITEDFLQPFIFRFKKKLTKTSMKESVITLDERRDDNIGSKAGYHVN